MKPVILGMVNPISDDPAHALYPHPPGCSGHRLWKFSGLEKRVYLSVFERRNVIGGQKWDSKLARQRAPQLREEFVGRMVVLLGAEVNSIMRGGTPHEMSPPFCWTPDGHGGWMAKVPHTSGLARFFNNTRHQKFLAIFMAELVHWASEHTSNPPTCPAQGLLI